MGEKIVHQHGVKGNPNKEIHRRAPNKTLREVKKAIKKAERTPGVTADRR